MKDYNMLDEIKDDIKRDEKFTKTNKNDGIIIKNSNEKDKAQDKAHKLHINIIIIRPIYSLNYKKKFLKIIVY